MCVHRDELYAGSENTTELLPCFQVVHVDRQDIYRKLKPHGEDGVLDGNKSTDFDLLQDKQKSTDSLCCIRFMLYDFFFRDNIKGIQ